MEQAIKAQAYPRKRFFLDMFTRDISVEDCILDLLDNSIDALIRTRRISLADLLTGPVAVIEGDELPSVDFTYARDKITIVDKCGGIRQDTVRNNVFSFGHTADYSPGLLGVYGVGMKRALFKLGDAFHIKSQTTQGGFEVELNVRNWAEKDEGPDDWLIDIDLIEGVHDLGEAGTAITISQLRQDTKQRFQDPMTMERLRKEIGRAYCLFLNRHVHLRMDGSRVEPAQLPIAESEEARAGKIVFEQDGVRVTILASLLPKEQWSYEQAGWYVFCNGRLVVAADKSDLTGWGEEFPLFHTKYNGFYGIAFFESENPLALPWTTTKRGLNRESPVYRAARKRMKILGYPVTTFLSRMHPTDPAETAAGMEIAQSVQQVSIKAMIDKPESQFEIIRKLPAEKATVRIQYDADKADVERAKKRIGRSSMGASRVGEYTLNYFLDKECPE